MRDMLLTVIKNVTGMVDVIKVTGTETETKLQAVDDSMNFFIEAILPPIPEFQGEFGLTNLSLLRRLLEFSSYKTDDASFTVERFVDQNRDAPVQFSFKDASGVGGATFRLMNAKNVPDQAEIRNIPWDITFKPSKGKLSEFQELAGIYSEVDKFFSIKTEAGKLLLCVGDDTSSTHYASLVVHEDSKATVNSSAVYSTQQFLSVLKIVGNLDFEIKVTRSVLGIESVTPVGTFKYYFRATSRQ